MGKCVISKMTPKEYKKLSSFNITYGTTDTQFGKCFIGLNNGMICFTTFVDGNNSGVADLKKSFPKATLTEDNQLINTTGKSLFDQTCTDNQKVLLKGTEFQTKVWEELVNIPIGSTTSYEQIAKAIGNPKAVRAVANAIANNPVSYLVPCHRVINKSGGIGKYGGGVQRKIQILKEEKAM